VIYNQALHPDDYVALAPWREPLQAFERSRMAGLNYRKDHTHREWEYARIMRQLTELFPDRTPASIRILDTGSGASYFIPYLKICDYDVVTSDSMTYGDITEWLRAQCFALNITIPLVVAPVERLGLEDNQWDVTMCISVIEHLPVTEFENGLRELYRVTKPGGYLFITSDYFRDEASALKSPSLGIQNNRFYPHSAQQKIDDVIDVEWIGGTNLTYREMPEAETVNGHSFVNFCFRKPLRSRQA